METLVQTKWAIDPTHSEIGFKVKHMMISTVTGHFEKFDATVESESDDFQNASIEFSAVIDSINTKNSDRDAHLKSDDFFGTEAHPTAQLVITQVGVDAAGGYQVTGDLTIKGITQPVSFPMTVADNTAKASLKIDRTLYDIRYGSNNFFENLGDKAINNEFDLEVTLQF